jgi:cytochrome c peroxidase
MAEITVRQICRMLTLVVLLVARFPGVLQADDGSGKHRDQQLDRDLAQTLRRLGFTGTAQQQLETRLGRHIDPQLADLGRLLFFDKIIGLHDDNACAGCHAPQNGFGDTQSIAIGIQSNGLVGRNRGGPRNQRRSPMLVNDAFFPKLMWNGRFLSLTNDPFDNSLGFQFPPPEGTAKFPPNDPEIRHLLQAQAHIPPTELTEAAGFTGTRGTLDPRLDQFDDGRGTPVPPPDDSGFRNEPIRRKVLERLNASRSYRNLFARSFPDVANGGPVTFAMFGQAIAEFQFTLTFADSPLDEFARGHHDAMTDRQKQGALVFFNKAGCVQCHGVSGQSNEMFSDFTNHRLAIPQIAPRFGLGKGDVIFDGNGEDEDFGAEQISGVAQDRYLFRTSPLRNVALQPAFFHNGAYTRLDDAIRFHLNALYEEQHYNAARAGIARDLRDRQGPLVSDTRDIDPLLQHPIELRGNEFQALLEFVRDGLLDQRARPESLCRLAPAHLPSGMPPLRFEGCR